MQVGAVIPSLDIAMKGDCGPGTCSGITGMPGYGFDVLQIEVDRDWWWRQCYWSEQAVQVPKGFASERKQAGIDLTGVVVYPPPIRATDPKSTFDLLWVEVMEIDDCTSEADSVSGNSIQGDNEDKTCQIDHGCPFDASEDAFLEGDQGRPLFTCDGCNRGFHAECVEERNAAAEFAWDVPARDTAFVKYGDWLCGDCVDEGGVLISTILDSACTNTSEAVWIVRQTGDEGRISCILNRELAKSAGQSQLLEDYRIRLRARAAAHQDIHGKLVDEVQAGLEGPRIKADGPELRIHRWGGRALAPSFVHFAQAEKTSEDQYGIWRLRTLLKRPTLIWAPKLPWQRSSKAARPMNQWKNFVNWCKNTHALKWYQASKEYSDALKKSTVNTSSIGSGSMPCHFLHTIHEELQWLPRGNIEDAWHGIINGALFHELEESTARLVHDQWLELVYEVGWVDRQKCKMDGQLDRMKRRDEAGHTQQLCYLADARQYDRKTLDQALQGQTVLKAVTITHMYE